LFIFYEPQIVGFPHCFLAKESNSGCCGDFCTTSIISPCCGNRSPKAEGISKKIVLSEADFNTVPGGANLDLGCGNPIAVASLKKGEIILNLGSGCLLQNETERNCKQNSPILRRS
jgi:hypothetical protein